MNYFKHKTAIVESNDIGDDTRVWAFAHILPGAKLGSDCNVCDHVYIENDVVIGDRVTIKCGVQLWDGLRISNDVFIGPNATFTNDQFPRSKVYPESFQTTVVENNASIGANATILPGLVIGSYAMVGAGTVVTRDVPSNAIVLGNPARIVGYTATDHPQKSEPELNPHVSGIRKDSKIPGVEFREFPLITDLRGSLTFAETNHGLPFTPERYFIVFNVQGSEVRGEHAHRSLSQFLVCVKGSCSVMVEDGDSREEYVLDSPTQGLLIPPMVWSVQYQYSSDAVLLVLASDKYDEADYIRDYGEFNSLRKAPGSKSE